MRTRFTRLIWFCNGIAGAFLALLGAILVVELSELGVRLSIGAMEIDSVVPAFAAMAVGISVVAVAFRRIRVTSVEHAPQSSPKHAMVAQAH